MVTGEERRNAERAGGRQRRRGGRDLERCGAALEEPAEERGDGSNVLRNRPPRTEQKRLDGGHRNV